MTANALKKRIDKMCSLVSFTYRGKDGHVDPYSHTEYLLWYDGEEMTVDSIDKVMDTPFFCGKTLTEIAGEIIDTAQ